MNDRFELAQYRLHNDNGMEVVVLPYGGIIQTLTAPDRNGEYGDIVLGFDTAADYQGKHPYFGAIVGRYANRIAGSRIDIDGKTYSLTPGRGGHHLHGGARGFDKALWRVNEPESTAATLRLSHVSEDGEEGYPGELSVELVYALGDDDELSIHYAATSNRTTVVNLSNHSYFNLSAGELPDILGHVLELNADEFTPVDADMIPTGELRKVSGTPMDFRQPLSIGARINDKDEQLGYGLGFDHNWVLNRSGDGLQFAARVIEPHCGRVLEVLTTEPGLQFYSGNRLDGSITGKGGLAYRARAGFCLETQHFPNSPNRPAFPSTVLRPGELFQSTTVFRFGTA